MSEAMLRVHVTPRASKNEVTGWRDDVLCVRVTSPPVEGAANAAVCKFIASALGLRKSQVELVSGEKSREKSLRIIGVSDEKLKTLAGDAVSKR